MGSEKLRADLSTRSIPFYRWKRRYVSKPDSFVLVIHGGAGTMVREDATPEKRVSYRTALDQALRAGYEILKNGGEAMDAAVVAVSALEGMSRSFCECSVLDKRLSPDCPLFNAGKGAVFNIAGKVCRVNYHYLLHTIVHLPSRMS